MVTSIVGPFEFGLATKQAEREACYRLRYRVYCEEYGWESAAEHPDGLEHDAYDAASLHILMRVPGSIEPVATCRLILPDANSIYPTPIFAALPIGAYEDHAFHPARLAPHTWLEASRLLVAPEYRRTSPLVAGMEAMQLSYFASAGLSLSLMALCNALQRPHCISAMEVRTARLLRRFGLDNTQIGEPFEYHGRRALFVTHADRILMSVAPELADVYAQLAEWSLAAVAEPVAVKL
jgi:N-acyl amino acid synthase of PEP-CTERM/exosortase system